MDSESDAASRSVSVTTVRHEGGECATDLSDPDEIESYDSLEFDLDDGRHIRLDVSDVIINSAGYPVGRIHSLRHLGGMDGWGYAVYLELPEENGREFGRSKGFRLGEVAEWFEQKRRTTFC